MQRAATESSGGKGQVFLSYAWYTISELAALPQALITLDSTASSPGLLKDREHLWDFASCFLTNHT